jgi:hypothetical protein
MPPGDHHFLLLIHLRRQVERHVLVLHLVHMSIGENVSSSATSTASFAQPGLVPKSLLTQAQRTRKEITL